MKNPGLIHFFIPPVMPKENGPFLSSFIFGTATAEHIYIGGSDGQSCLYKDQDECWWCESGGAPTATCMAGYAGCFSTSHTSGIGKSPLSTTSDGTKTIYTCTSSGWIAQTSSGGGDSSQCDRYSYKSPTDNLCYPCPEPDFTTEDGEQLLPRGDNYLYLLTGCNIYVNNFTSYKDKTGIFVFTESNTCYHSGIL